LTLIGTRKLDIYSTDLKPYGKTFTKWAELWIKWILSIPKGCNPVADLTGEHWNQNQNQNGPVLFLAGGLGILEATQCWAAQDPLWCGSMSSRTIKNS
jgi:hypothetical protein